MNVLLNAGIAMIFFMPLSSLYPLMSSSYFQVSALHAGIVEFVYALGMILSSVGIGMISQKHSKMKLARLGLLGVGLTTALCGILPPTIFFFWIFALLCLIMGGCGNVYGIPLMTYMQETIAPEKQGRAFSLLGSVMSLAMPVGLVIAGPFAETFGVAGWFLISGIVITLTTIWMEILVWKRT